MHLKKLKDQCYFFQSTLPEEWDRIVPHIEEVDMPAGMMLYDYGEAIKYIYFPATSIVSLMHVLEDGSTMEMAAISHEGVVGIPILLGAHSTPNSAVVQSAGFGYRIKARILLEEFHRCEKVMHLLLLYTQALITQISQTAVCNCHHSTHQRLSKCLLFNSDLKSSNQLTLTQGHIASMIGVRREGVTLAACKLQKEGLIEYANGLITILDRKELENRACECYSIIKSEYARLLPERQSSE